MIWSHFPFKKVPGRSTIELIMFVVLWLNSFLPERGALQMYSSHAIVTEYKLYFRKQCRFNCSLYVKAHKHLTLWNKMLESTCGSIWLVTTENLQGSYNLLLPRAKQLITQNHIHYIPIRRHVIQRVYHIKTQEKRNVPSYQVKWCLPLRWIYCLNILWLRPECWRGLGSNCWIHFFLFVLENLG